MVVDSVNAPGMRDRNVTRDDGARCATCLKLIFAAAREDRPRVLSLRVNMCRYALARLDVPGHNGCFRRLRDNRSDGFTFRGLHEIGALENASGTHVGLRSLRLA